MGAEAKLSRINTKFKQKKYGNLIDDCKAYLKQYNTEHKYDVCIILAQSHFKLNQFAQGVSAIEDAKKIAKAQGNIQRETECVRLVEQEWLRLLVDAKSGLIKNIELTASSERIRAEMRDPAYMMVLERLKREHEKKPSDFQAQVIHINNLMNFLLTTYAHRKGYIRAQYLDGDQGVKTSRLKIADKMLLSGLRSEANVLFDLDTLLELGEKEIDELCTDIYLDDAQLVLRMVFKTIHSLPRDKCKELVHLLPWGSNSWYFLYFIGSLMEIYGDHYFNTLFSLSTLLNNTDEQMKTASNYFASLRFSNCTLKVALLDPGVWEDLRKLKRLFSDIQENLQTNGNTLTPEQLLKIDELPTLKKLVWYFKHLYNLYRLQGVLPNDVDIGTLIHKSHVNLLDAKRDPMALLLKMDLMGSRPKAGDLKSHLAFLRRLELVGELFTRKNWGFFLNTMDYFDPLTVINIRNALVHIEQLTNSEAIFRLEGNTARLCALHKELSDLKCYLLEVVLNSRDANFRSFPAEDQMRSLQFWKSDVSEYWESVKDYYEQQFKEFKFEEDASPYYKENFLPRVPLLSPGILHYRLENRIRKTLAMEEGADINFNVYILFLRKVFATHQRLLADLENSFLGNKVLNKDDLLDNIFKILQEKDPNLPVVKALVEAAEMRSNELRRVKREALEARREQFDAELAEKEERRKNLIKTNMESSYPHIQQNAVELANELNGAKPSVTELVNRLKNRISILQRLFNENGTTIRVEQQDIITIQQHLAVDVNLYFATSYLVGQIVSLLNKLHSLDELKEIHPDLSPLLKEYVGLRNALEHSDPFLDSEKAHQVMMENRLPDAIAYLISEIVGRYGACILSHVPRNIPVALAVEAVIPAAALPLPDVGKVKQLEAFDISKFISICDQRLKKFRSSSDYVRPSNIGFFAPSSASPRSLLKSSSAMPVNEAGIASDSDSDYLLFCPNFSSTSRNG